MIDTLGPGDRDDWERLFRGYIAFYERTIPDEEYERAWQRFQAATEIHALGAYEDGRLIGIAHFFTHPHTNNTDVCYLQDLFTDPAARGRGAARALIERIAEWARERDCCQLYWRTRDSNTTARALYDQVAQFRGFIVYQRDL